MIDRTIFLCVVTLPGSAGPPATCRRYQVSRFCFNIRIELLTLKYLNKHICTAFISYLDLFILQQPAGASMFKDLIFDIRLNF